MPSPARVLASLVLCSLVFATGGCREIVGIEERTADEPTGHDAAPSCGDFRAGGQGCGACTEAHCCAEGAACRADPECGGAFDCASACDGSGDECRAKCVPSRSDAMAALASCQATSCASECGLKCGGVYGMYLGRLATRSKACRDCVTTRACAAATACAASTSCLKALGCGENCPPLDEVCGQQCRAALPDAAQLLAGVFTEGAACAKECERGKQWACVGNASRPVTSEHDASLSIQVMNSAFTAPLANTQVHACDVLSSDCVPPLATGTSGPDGWVTLGISVSGSFRGYLDFTGPANMPNLFYQELAGSVPRDETFPFQVGLISAPTVAFLGQAVHVPIDPARAILFAQALDCELNFASGVSFTASGGDGSTVAWYFANGLPHIDTSQTDGNGGGGFVNLPPGLITVTASVASIGVVGTASVWTRPNTITTVVLTP